MIIWQIIGTSKKHISNEYNINWQRVIKHIAERHTWSLINIKPLEEMRDFQSALNKNKYNAHTNISQL